ncbi:MAG TPA: hypothetical protein IGP91_09185 [Thermosynechococcus sp. M46_R2017_013]|nr:hypothetical protein [Thermosynechococcus sp. M46_R2017_013]
METKRKIFGAIQPHPQHGYLQVRVLNGQVTQPEAQGKSDLYGEEQGTLVLDYSPEVPDDQKGTLANLAKHLAWLMFHLGGIGQGARRPCYSRQERPNPRPPWWRGSDLIPMSNPENKDEHDFWEHPEDPKEFKQKFQEYLQKFYTALYDLGNRTINPTEPSLLSVGTVNTDQWEEVADKNCRIILCWGSPENRKSYGLACLHHNQFKQRNGYDKNLCGSTGKPSPVWVANLDDYQVITIFGVPESQDNPDNPRLKFVNKLKKEGQYNLLFPFTKKVKSNPS